MELRNLNLAMDRETEKDRILSGLTEKFRKSNEINYCEQSQMNIKYSNLIGDRQKRCIRDERSARTIDTSSFSSYLNSPSSVLSFAFQFRVFFFTQSYVSLESNAIN